MAFTRSPVQSRPAPPNPACSFPHLKCVQGYSIPYVDFVANLLLNPALVIAISYLLPTNRDFQHIFNLVTI